MSIYLHTREGVGHHMVASNHGWSQFGEWVAGLDTENAEFVPTRTLFDWGVWEDNTNGNLADSLGAARSAKPPIRDVAGVIDEILSVADGAQFFVITNGMMRDEPLANTKETKAQTLSPWTDAELDAMTDSLSEDDLREALELATPDKRALLGAQPHENDGDNS